MKTSPERLQTHGEMLDRREARVERASASAMPTLWGHLADLHGRPMPAIRALNPELSIKQFPRLAQLRFTGGGARWANLGTGAEGDGVIELVMWLAGGCERSKAVDFLENTLAELGVGVA